MQVVMTTWPVQPLVVIVPSASSATRKSSSRSTSTTRDTCGYESTSHAGFCVLAHTCVARVRVLQEFLQHVVDTEITASKLVWNTLLELWLRAFTVLDAGEGASDAGASAIVRQCCMRVC